MDEHATLTEVTTTRNGSYRLTFVLKSGQPFVYTAKRMGDYMPFINAAIQLRDQLPAVVRLVTRRKPNGFVVHQLFPVGTP